MAELSRREAVRRLAAGGAAAALPLWGENLLAIVDLHAAARPHAAAPAAAWTPKVFDHRQAETVATLVELILPETDTPGAREAGVHQSIDAALADARTDDRDAFIQGLGWLDLRSQARYGAPFAAADPQQQVELLTALSTPTDPAPDDRPGVEFFRTIRSMTIAGYYTSEIGILQDLGEPETMVFLEFKGCSHPEHR